MSRLGRIIINLVKGEPKEEQTPFSEVPFSTKRGKKNYPLKISQIIRVFLFSFLIGMIILGGFLVYYFLSLNKNVYRNISFFKAREAENQNALTKAQAPSTQGNITNVKTEEVKEEELNEKITRNMNEKSGTSKLSLDKPRAQAKKKDKKSKNIAVLKKEEEKKFLIAKKPKSKEKKTLEATEVDEKVMVKDTPILRDSNFLNNILFNAEEARKSRNWDEAIYYYEQYLKFKVDPDVLNNLGGVYFQRGYYLKAKSYFEKAYKIKQEETYLVNIYKSQIALGDKETPCKEIKTKEFSPLVMEEINKLKKLCSEDNMQR